MQGSRVCGAEEPTFGHRSRTLTVCGWVKGVGSQGEMEVRSGGEGRTVAVRRTGSNASEAKVRDTEEVPRDGVSSFVRRVERLVLEGSGDQLAPMRA